MWLLSGKINQNLMLIKRQNANLTFQNPGHTKKYNNVTVRPSLLLKQDSPYTPESPSPSGTCQKNIGQQQVLLSVLTM